MSSVMSKNGSKVETPALLTRMSSRPSSPLIVANMSLIWLTWLTSARIVVHWPPADSMAATVSAGPSCSLG